MLEWFIVAVLAIAIYYIINKYEKKIEILHELIEANRESIRQNKTHIEKNRDEINSNKSEITKNTHAVNQHKKRLDLNQELLTELKDL